MLRSFLFVPGDGPRKLDKALRVGADALFLDIEDSVALAVMEAARRTTADFMCDAPRHAGHPRLFVWVIGLETVLMDED